MNATIRRYGAFFLVVCMVGLGDGARGAARRPNILLVVSDDQRADTIHALGNRIIQTPNLDRLVQIGIAFTQAHVAHPVCVPSRAELLTGLTGFKNGVHAPYSTNLKDTATLLPMLLRAAGYATWYVGKWHTSGRPGERGYSDTLGLFAGGGGKFWKDQVDYKGMAVTGYRGWIFQTNEGKLFPEKGVGLTPNISEHFADAAIEFIQRKPEQPFFLHVNFTAPHDPLYLPKGNKNKYAADDLPLPANFMADHPFDHGNQGGRDELLQPRPLTPKAIRENLAAYYAVISHLDEQLGRIMKALDDTGQRDNTIVIFTSDHGLAVGSHGLVGKQNMYGHTLLVPLIISGPGVPRGQRSNALAYLRDLHATICDVAGVEQVKTDSVSLLPLLNGQKKQIRERLFCCFADSQRMVRERDWKLIHYPKIDRYQLFDVANDPFEMRDRFWDPQVQDRGADLRSELQAWQKRVGDPAR